MLTQRYRFIVCGFLAVAGIWLAVMAAHWWLEGRRMTADKLRAYMESMDFSQLTGEARMRALRDLADKLNALSYEERRRLRGEQLMRDWFARMSDEEKAWFIEATLPTGFKQMINAFEQMPEEQRKKAIDDALKNLRMPNRPGPGTARNGNQPPPISPELEAKIRTIGLNAFYSQSSAQTKAELAPLLEELQRQMESGRNLRR